MIYWERWIGDWKRKTAHLTAEAKGIYAELLDHQYATHKHLPLDLDACRRIANARTPSEAKAVDAILDEFFDKTEFGYMNPRALQEIAKREKYVQEQKDRANKRWGKADADGVIHSKANGAWWKSREGREEMAAKHNVKTRIGEETHDYTSRIFEAINAAKAQEQP